MGLQLILNIALGGLLALMCGLFWRARKHNRMLRTDISVLSTNPRAPLSDKLVQTLRAVVALECRAAVDKRFDELLAAGPKALAQRATTKRRK